MLRDSDMGKDLWGEALLTHIYIRKQCPSSTLPGNITPYEKVFGHVPVKNGFSDMTKEQEGQDRQGNDITNDCQEKALREGCHEENGLR